MKGQRRLLGDESVEAWRSGGAKQVQKRGQSTPGTRSHLCKCPGVARAERASGSRWEFRPAGWTVEVTFLISANLSFLTYKIEQ